MIRHKLKDRSVPVIVLLSLPIMITNVSRSAAEGTVTITVVVLICAYVVSFVSHRVTTAVFPALNCIPNPMGFAELPDDTS